MKWWKDGQSVLWLYQGLQQSDIALQAYTVNSQQWVHWATDNNTGAVPYNLNTMSFVLSFNKLSANDLTYKFNIVKKT